MKITSTLRLSLLASLLSCGVQAAESAIELTPVGGWRTGESKDANFRQNVNYPANSVNTPQGQGNATLIQGRINNLPKENTLPAKLVLNGLTMPMRVESDGSFQRPFNFPAGSNSIEVISPDGKQRKRAQFLNGGGNGEVAAKLRVILSWDTDNTDLDLHLVTPDGGHVWYGNRVLPNGLAQDVDVTTGFGPEIMASPTPIKGRYLVYVNYYGGYNSGGESGPILTTAQVTIVTEEGTINEKMESFLIPMRQPGELTFVKSFNYP